MQIQTITLNAQRNVTLTAYLQSVGGEFPNIPRRPAILVIPGGGYSMCSDREADPVALAYLQAGYQAFVLRYSVGPHAVWPTPLNDYEQAMELIRSQADAWNLYPDKVAVVGFSAGGHLAGVAATLSKNRPAAAILGYPVLEGETARQCEATAPDLVSAVDGSTCPCFLFATRTDNIVPITNTLNFASALAKFGIGFESHIYAYGPHGFSVGNSSVVLPGTDLCSRAANWVADSIAWLQDVMGDFGSGALTEPRCSRRVNDDCEPFLSVDCTMSLLMSNPQARQVLAPMMEAAQKRLSEQYGDQLAQSEQQTSMGEGLGAKMTLRTALSYANLPREMVDKLNAALKQIPNV